jgi:uncharacterized membrane protein
VNSLSPDLSQLESVLAKFLRYGTWLASSVIAIGCGLLAMEARSGAPRSTETVALRCLTAGIAFLILLPVARVAIMLWFFLRERDYRLAFAAALVLTTIAAGVAVGIH